MSSGGPPCPLEWCCFLPISPYGEMLLGVVPSFPSCLLLFLSPILCGAALGADFLPPFGGCCFHLLPLWVVLLSPLAHFGWCSSVSAFFECGFPFFGVVLCSPRPILPPSVRPRQLPLHMSPSKAASSSACLFGTKDFIIQVAAVSALIREVCCMALLLTVSLITPTVFWSPLTLFPLLCRVRLPSPTDPCSVWQFFPEILKCSSRLLHHLFKFSVLLPKVSGFLVGVLRQLDDHAVDLAHCHVTGLLLLTEEEEDKERE